MHWNSCEDDSHLASTLADAVAHDLQTAIAQRQHALIALSGGRTPERFLKQLGQRELDWSRVTVTLVDERWVPADHPRANAGLVRRNLLLGKAAQACFVPLYADFPTPEDGLATVSRTLASLDWPLDVAVLGMGEDGHTASFFPGGDHLDAALDPRGGELVLPMRAPEAGEPRITLTLPVLVQARALYLQIEGDTKRRVLIDAVHGSGVPIGSVLDAAPGLQAYWCP